MPNIAHAEWTGDLTKGQGRFDTGDGSISGSYSFKSRFEGKGEGGANPEELIAAAHASCFSMALSADLAEHGHAPESIKTTVEVTLKLVDGTPTITTSAIRTVGKVANIDAEHFAQHAQQAKEGCAVSRALAAVSEITLEAELES